MTTLPALSDAANKQRARDVFEKSAEHYARERELLPYFRAQIRHLGAMLEGESGRVLDIGCAAGAEIEKLRAVDFSVVGVDMAQRMVEFARRRFADDPEVALCRADAEQLPFADESFDHVACLGVFEFLTDHTPAVREIRRVLRPGGLAVFAIPSRISLYRVSEQVVEATVIPVLRGAKRVLGRQRRPGAARARVQRNLVVPWRFRDLLRQEGFAPERSFYTNFFVYPLHRFPKVDVRVAALLEPLCSVPVVRGAASVYMASARAR